MKLENRIALITGGSRGIGAAISSRFAKEGAHVVIVYANNTQAAEDVVNDIKSKGGKAHAIQCDISCDKARTALFDEVVSQFGRIDILVNNAAVLVNKAIKETNLDDWYLNIKTNLESVFFLSKACAELMKSQQGGKIVCISSAAASCAFPNVCLYSMAKAAMNIMAKCFTAEYAKFKINTNTVSPGNTATDINKHLREDPEFYQWVEEHTPTGRAYITPTEIANAALFLASDEASAVHGIDLVVDDGWRI